MVSGRMVAGAACAAAEGDAEGQPGGPPPGVKVSAGERDKQGVLVHGVDSPFQAAATKIRVLLPDTMEKGKRK